MATYAFLGHSLISTVFKSPKDVAWATPVPQGLSTLLEYL